MSTMMDYGVKMRCKAVTVNLFTVEDLFVEPINIITKPKGFLESYISIR